MTDQQLITACADKVMGWHVYPLGKSGPTSEFPCLIETVDHEWVLVKTQDQWGGTPWRPLDSLNDAFMLINSDPAAAFVLSRDGTRWTASVMKVAVDVGGPHPYRRNGHGGSANTCRAIVVAALRSRGIEVPDGMD